MSKGKVPCSCSTQRQKQAYINIIKDIDTGETVALKFGISSSATKRLKNQGSKTTKYLVELFDVWYFDSVQNCKAAERACKKLLECAILPKDQFRDGYTETTYPHNLNKIIEFFEINGGKRDKPEWYNV